MKVRQLEKLLKDNGWTSKPRTATSHRTWVKDTERLTVTGNPKSEAKKWLEKAVLKKLGIDNK